MSIIDGIKDAMWYDIKNPYVIEHNSLAIKKSILTVTRPHSTLGWRDNISSSNYEELGLEIFLDENFEMKLREHFSGEWISNGFIHIGKYNLIGKVADHTSFEISISEWRIPLALNLSELKNALEGIKEINRLYKEED